MSTLGGGLNNWQAECSSAMYHVETDQKNMSVGLNNTSMHDLFWIFDI